MTDKMSLHFKLVNLLAVLVTYLPLIFGETGCPAAEEVYPCICTDETTPRLYCANIVAPSVLRGVFNKTERYSFQEVYIRLSTLIYIPHEIFDKTRIGELFIQSSVVIELFDRAPRSGSFYKLQLDRTAVRRGSFYEKGLLRNITTLKYLLVSDNRLKTISSNFSSKVPNSLKEISFNQTNISRIAPGALNELVNLDKFAVQSSKLSNLTRDVFPTPFNVRFLYFDNNKITSIPDDLFTDMPNLQFLTMRHNFISVIPETAFSGRTLNVPYLGFEGNPLKCNCLLVWIVKDKPEVIGGTCSSPKILRGRHLQNLLPGDFNC